MGIFTKTVEPEPTTSDSLKQTLLDARSERDKAVFEADAVYETHKAFVIDAATARVAVVGGLIADLQTEQTALNSILESL